MGKINLLKKFLSYFGEPAVRLIPEKKDLWKSATNIKIKIEDVLKTNEKWYWAFFTPNGNYWKWLKEWEKYNVKKENWKWWNALFVDLDFNDELKENVEEQKKFILDKLDLYKLQPHFLVKTWRWWHVYFLLDEDAKWLENKVYEKILEFLADEVFKPYWDNSNLHIAKLMRLPYTYWWKKGQKLVELYYLQWWEFVK